MKCWRPTRPRSAVQPIDRALRADETAPTSFGRVSIAGRSHAVLALANQVGFLNATHLGAHDLPAGDRHQTLAVETTGESGGFTSAFVGTPVQPDDTALTAKVGDALVGKLPNCSLHHPRDVQAIVLELRNELEGEAMVDGAVSEEAIPSSDPTDRPQSAQLRATLSAREQRFDVARQIARLTVTTGPCAALRCDHHLGWRDLMSSCHSVRMRRRRPDRRCADKRSVCWRAPMFGYLLLDIIFT